MKDEVKEFSRRGDISTTGFNIAKMYKEGKLKELAGLQFPKSFTKTRKEKDQSTSQTQTKSGDFVEEKTWITSARKASLLT